MKASPVDKLLDLTQAALGDGSFVKLTLSAPRGSDKSLKNVQVRAIELRGQPHLAFVYRHATRDITRNFTPEDGLALLREILGSDFLHAHLFTTRQSAQLELRNGHGARLREGPPQHDAPPSPQHDKARQRLIKPDRPWLRALGVTTPEGRVAKGMEAKFRQIQKFVEVFAALLQDAGLSTAEPISICDMGCGKGYLTFALYDWLQHQGGRNIRVSGVEARPELVEAGNQIARQNKFDGLTFAAGNIASTPVGAVDVLIALHACDTATDDAIARGIEAGARLVLVSPCCHRELRPQLTPPAPLADALRHGILREREAEFVTDALRAALLDWAGYEPKVFEFISTEHTAKNLMIAGLRRTGTPRKDPEAARARELAAHYGIRSQRLAQHLQFDLPTPA